MRRTQKLVDKLVTELERTGIPLTACSKVGVSRSTYYRWRQEDVVFKLQTDEAIQIGRENITDLAESKLVKNIGDGNQRAIEFQLRHNDSRYRYFSQQEFVKVLESRSDDEKPEISVMQTVLDTLFDTVKVKIQKMSSNGLQDAEVDEYTRELLEIEGKKDGAIRHMQRRIEEEAEIRLKEIHAHYAPEEDSAQLDKQGQDDAPEAIIET